MFAAHPLAGVGPDNFRLAYGGYLGLASTDERTHSNNMYLEMLAGGGLLVVGAFGWLALAIGGLRDCAGCDPRLERAGEHRAGARPVGRAASRSACTPRSTPS